MANLQGARLWYPNPLRGANLQGAILLHANLQDAELGGANLQDANLGGAYLVGARFLTQGQLDEADGDDRTVLPTGLTRPAHWMKAKPEPSAQPEDVRGAPPASGAPEADK